MTARKSAATSFVLVAACSLAGCTDPRTAAVEEGAAPVTVAPSAVQPPAPQCREQPTGRVLSAFASGACGAVLAVDERGVGLWTLSADGPDQPARGEAPGPCAKASCTFFGYDSALGPVVVVVVADHRSEMPAGVWLGLALDLAGQQLVFFDLWAGAEDTVVGDGTDLGPPHSLAPFMCRSGSGGRSLGLFSVPRLPGGTGVDPIASMVAREGIYTWNETTAERASADRSGCSRVAVELP